MTLTIAVCTAGRDSLIHTIKSISQQSYPPEMLLIVDQSGKGSARQAVEESGYSGRYLVIDQDEKGLSKARNEVVRRVDTDWVFFTDDDCLVSLDLVDQFHKNRLQFPNVAFMAGTCIRPIDYNPKTHDVPGVCIKRQSELNQDTVMKDEMLMGACLAFRKDLLDKTGLFDPYLGAGTDWPAGEECDYVFRAVAKGFIGLATPRLVVFHDHGARLRRPDDTENGRIGNAVVIWKAQQMGDPKLVEMAFRICPYGPKKVMLAKLTFGMKFPIELRMYKKCLALYKQLSNDFIVTDGLLVKK